MEYEVILNYLVEQTAVITVQAESEDAAKAKAIANTEKYFTPQLANVMLVVQSLGFNKAVKYREISRNLIDYKVENNN